jgi:hypothetical protein
MDSHTSNAVSFLVVLIAALIVSPSLGRVDAAQTNTRLGTGALPNNTGNNNTAVGYRALRSNTTGKPKRTQKGSSLELSSYW